MLRRLCRVLLGLARCFSSALSLGDRGKVMAQPGCIPGLGCHRGGAGFAPLRFWEGVFIWEARSAFALFVQNHPLLNFCCRKAALLVLYLPLLPQRLEKPS